MAASTGFVLVAAGIAAANEAIFAPAVANKPLWVDFNWRIVPATAIAALTLAGLEQISPPLGKGLAMLALLAVLIRPMGNAPSPVENASKLLGL
jgi:hypothetical protein